MKNTDQIKNALNLLREADSGTEASPFLETRLRAAFREQHAAVAPPKPAPWWTAWRLWAAVATGCLVLGAVVFRVATPGSVQAPPAPAAAVLQAPLPAASTPQPKVEVAAAVVPKPKRANPRSVPRRQQPAVEVQTAATASEPEEFLAIPYAPPLTAYDRGEIIRVRLPRQSLRRMGIPVNPERLLERVPADVLVGEDGVPRGIRLVRVSESR